MKIRPVGAESFHAGGWTDITSGWTDITSGWTDITKLIVTFRNFTNAPENSQVGQPAFVNPGLSAYEAEVLPNWP